MIERKYQLAFDDFGISQKTNDRIIEFIQTLSGSRVAVMMNGRWSAEEKEMLYQSNIFLDLHLDRHEQAFFQNSQKGLLMRVGAFLREYRKEHDSQLLLQSWERQIKQFQETFGRMPDRLNSHEHVHFFPAYFKALIQLALKFDIAEVRFGTAYTKNYTKIAFVLNVLRCCNKKSFQQSKLSTSKYLLSFDWLKRETAHKELTACAQRGETEVVFHLERDEEYLFLKNTF